MLSFQQIERIIEHALPASAYNYAAFWSNSSSYSRAWRDAGREVSCRDLLPENVRFTQTHLMSGTALARFGPPTLHIVPEMTAVTRSVETPADAVGSPQGLDVLLLGCVKSKATSPQRAKDLYVTDLFAKRRRYANQRGLPWFVLSAEHGLLRQDDWVAPHDVLLKAQVESYRRAWGAWVIERLRRELGTLEGVRLEVHAGDACSDALIEPGLAAGATLIRPMQGLHQREQLAWYQAHPASPSP